MTKSVPKTNTKKPYVKTEKRFGKYKSELVANQSQGTYRDGQPYAPTFAQVRRV